MLPFKTAVTSPTQARVSALMSGSHLVLSEQLRLLQDEIALLRTSCRDALAEADAAGLVRAPKMPIDDVFLLRFLLSNGRTAATAADNLSSCIRWRIQNKEKIAAIHNGVPFKGPEGYGPPPHWDKLKPFMCAGVHGALKDGSPIVIVRAGISNIAGVLNVVSHEELVEFFLLGRESQMVMCDEASRQRDRVIKVFSITDLNHSNLFAMDKRFFAALGGSGKLSEIYYPQILGKGLIINQPRVFTMMMTIVRPFMTKKNLEKQVLCKGTTWGAGAGLISTCPFVSAFVDAAQIPSFLGGSCTCSAKGGCIAGVDNNRTSLLGVELPAGEIGSGMAVVNVPARNFVEIPVFDAPADAKAQVAWSLALKAMGISFSVFTRHADGSSSVAVPETKFKVDDGPQEGTFEVAAGGRVFMRLDNSYSIINGKTVFYKFFQVTLQ